MKVTTLVLNENGEPHFFGEDHFNIENLIEIAKKGEKNAKEKGADWTAGAIPFYGKAVVEAVNTGENEDVANAIIELLISAWLFDSIYCGLTAKHYLESDMKFTIRADGAVAHTRVNALSEAQ